MKELTAYIFPDTIPLDGVLFPLVQVFEQVVYCQAVENDETADERSSLAGELARQGLCEFHAPAPLGEHRDRFLALIADLRTRRDDYASQLGNLSLAGLGQATHPMGESKTSIISSLLRSSGIDDTSDEKREMLLWQARLLLKLGEIFDTEQARLESELERIRARESGLFAELREETGNDFPFTRSLHATTTLTDGQLAHRLKAWTRLYFSGDPRPDSPHVFVTTSRDGLDRLGEEYEKLKDTPARQLLRLALPGRPAGQDDIGSRSADVRAQLQGLPVTLSALLGNADTTGQEQLEQFAEQNSPWTELLKQIYPAETCGRRHLTLVHFPYISAEQLFMETFGREKDTLQQEIYKEKETGVVIGHLG